ncbi:MAG: TetR/AcrR family transcriptional regulator [Actinomycetales bacterium]|nr:TetR/AcrR family transcriptional regulator [Actinomycetales bacterium]
MTGGLADSPPDTEVANRDRLVTAATESFASKGFHATTTRDISSAAGMSQAALYVHYPSKEEVLYLICRTGLEELHSVMVVASQGATDPADGLGRVARAFAVWHAEHTALAKVANYELSALTPEHWQVVRECRHRIELCFREHLQQGMGTGAFSVSDAHMTTFSIISMGTDIARWYRPDRTWTVDQVADHYAAMVLRLAGAEHGRGGDEPQR